MLYIIGSLRNPNVPKVAAELRANGFDVFDEWFSAGKYADDAWQAYERQRGHSFAEALDSPHARHVFYFDYAHLNNSDAVVLVAPAGKSAHLELGWALGQGKPGYVLLDGEPPRFDLMYRFCTGVFSTVIDLIEALEG